MRTRRNTVRPYPVTRSGVEGLIRPSSIPHGWTARGWRRCLRRRGAIHLLGNAVCPPVARAIAGALVG